jgi:PPOX class probable F420-dependent enzyme
MTTIQAVAEAPGVRLADARFIDLVTFRRTGEPVGTPVLFVPDGNRLLIRTAAGTGKLKRLAHTPDVEVTPSDQRGRHVGATAAGTARVLGPEAVGPALAALHRRHRIAGPIATFIRHRRGQRDVIVEVTLDAVP